MPRPKDVLTTGEVAKICNVAPRTVSKWFDTGKLRGYRIPGSKDRRIPLQQLLRFMRAHGMPLNGLDTGITRVLVSQGDADVAELLSKALAREAGYEVQVARSAFETGVVTEGFKPHIMLLDVALPGLSGRETIRAIKNPAELAGTRLVAMTGPLQAGEEEELRQQGFDAVLVKPFEVAQVVEIIEDALAIVY